MERTAGVFYRGEVRDFDQGELSSLFNVFNDGGEVMRTLVQNYVRSKRAAGMSHPSVFRFGNAELQALVDDVLREK